MTRDSERAGEPAAGQVRETAGAGGDVEQQGSEDRKSERKKPPTLNVIVGSLLTVIACPLIAVALTYPYALPYPYALNTAATAGLAVLVADVFLFGGIALLFGRSRIGIAYLVNSLFLLAASLYTRPWSVVIDAVSVELLELIAVFPCMGTLLFSALAVRQAPNAVMRIVAWILVHVGGVTTLAFLIALVMRLT